MLCQTKIFSSSIFNLYYLLESLNHFLNLISITSKVWRIDWSRTAKNQFFLLIVLLLRSLRVNECIYGVGVEWVRLLRDRRGIVRQCFSTREIDFKLGSIFRKIENLNRNVRFAFIFLGAFLSFKITLVEHLTSKLLSLIILSRKMLKKGYHSFLLLVVA